MESSGLLDPGRVSSRARARLATAFFLGLVARLTLSLKIAYYYDDGAIFGSWARALRDHPLGEFYSFASKPDHLPGDLWFLKVLQAAYTAFGGHDFGSPAFQVALKTVPMAADMVIGVLVFRLVRTWASEATAVRAAQWYLLNPAIIVLSAVWGQWDALSAAFLLGGLLLVVRGGRSWVWAAPWLAWAVLVKPPLAIVEVVIVLGLLAMARPRFEHLRPPVVRPSTGAAFAGLGVLTALALLAPFRIGLAWAPAAGWTLAERLHYAAGLHPVSTMGAANLWMIVDRRVIGRADDVARWGPITPASVGALLLLVILGATAVTAWRAFPSGRQTEALLWSASAAAYGACLVMTRAHERYYFPALVLALLWCSSRAFDRYSSQLFWVFSALFTIDLAVPIGWAEHNGGPAHQPAMLVLLGLLHVAFFGALLAAPWRGRAPSDSGLVDGGDRAPLVERHQADA